MWTWKKREIHKAGRAVLSLTQRRFYLAEYPKIYCDTYAHSGQWYHMWVRSEPKTLKKSMHNAGVAVQGRTGTIAVERSDVLRSLSIYQHKTVMTNSSSHSDESALLKKSRIDTFPFFALLRISFFPSFLPFTLAPSFLSVMADSKVEYDTEKQQYESTVIQTTTEVITTQKERFDEKGERIYVVSDTERKLVRKLDFIYVMPIIAVINFLQASHPRLDHHSLFSQLIYDLALDSSLTSPRSITLVCWASKKTLVWMASNLAGWAPFSTLVTLFIRCVACIRHYIRNWSLEPLLTELWIAPQPISVATSPRCKVYGCSHCPLGSCSYRHICCKELCPASWPALLARLLRSSHVPLLHYAY